MRRHPPLSKQEEKILERLPAITAHIVSDLLRQWDPERKEQSATDACIGDEFAGAFGIKVTIRRKVDRRKGKNRRDLVVVKGDE